MKSTSAKVPEFVPVSDPPEIIDDPLNRRIFACFDAMRRRGVGADKCAFTISQIFAQAAKESDHPAPRTGGIHAN